MNGMRNIVEIMEGMDVKTLFTVILDYCELAKQFPSETFRNFVEREMN